MKMKLYYVVEKRSDDTCEMIAGPLPYDEAYGKAYDYNDPEYFFVVHRWIEVE